MLLTIKKHSTLLGLLVCFMSSAWSQTDRDAIMMYKNTLCTGFSFQQNQWTNYWEGSFKRDNANLGTVSTNSYAIMANYGITNKVNVLASLPYVKTKTSAGQLHPMQGVQDLSLWVKWQTIESQVKTGTFSLFALGGFSMPVSNYPPDFLPLSIGMGSNNLSLRVMADYAIGDWFVTGSTTYIRRSNITIDRPAYYTTEMHYTNEVRMPDVAQSNLRAGLRKAHLIAELTVYNWTTLGGYDIAKNNMPFPSNRMNMTSIGAQFKYETKFLKGLSLIGGADYVIAGRNIGQSSSLNAGVFYAVNLNHD